MRKKYGQEIWKNVRSYAVWLPGSPLELGDYGVLRENCFERIGSIHELSPGFQPQVSDSKLDSLRFSSDGVSELKAKAGGKLAKITYQMATNSAVVFQAKALVTQSLLNLPELSAHLSECEHWENSWQVVTGVTRASRFNAFIGGRAGTQFSVTSDPDVLALLQAPVADAAAEIRVEGDCALNLAGKSGPVMVNLHRMRLFGSGLKFATPAEAAAQTQTLMPYAEVVTEE